MEYDSCKRISVKFDQKLIFLKPILGHFLHINFTTSCFSAFSNREILIVDSLHEYILEFLFIFLN